nr:LAGLIDADG family homing endonuclease [uncultured Halomonas sp.]
MAKLSDKYMAGFIDSDGHIGMAYRYLGRDGSDATRMRTHVVLEFSQLTRRDEVLYQIQEAIGGSISFDKKRDATNLRLLGKKAEMALSRIRKHLVVKRHYAGVVLDMAGKIVDRKESTAFLKTERKRKSLPLPNYPSRKWMAGYLDGDGCFNVRLPKGRTSAQVTLEACASCYDSESVELMQKAFGGSITPTTESGRIVSYTLTLPPSKAEQVIGHCGKYLLVKKPQSDFILGCAQMGHYRDGKRIKAIAKQLKSQPHRLSEPEPDIQALLDSVDGSIETPAEKGRRKWANGGCGCGAPHYSGGVCRKCYDKKRHQAMRQSGVAHCYQ